MGLLQHQELMLIKGVGKTPGDTQSSEVDPVIVNLLDADSGFALMDWSPNIPSLKSGGIWADSSISDGRTLIAGLNTNVIETITFQLTGSTSQSYAANFVKLQRMIQSARDFWDTFGQIEPVYLRWWSSCAPAPQFALVFSIDLDVDFQDAPMATSKITMKLEREFGWRGVKPGGNPKEWYYHSIGQDSSWKASNANLLSGNDHVISTTIQNRAEQNSSASGYNTQNFIDIPASKIPGDLPALVSLSVQQAVLVTATTVYVGKSTKPVSGNISRNTGNNQLTVYTFNAGDGLVGTDTTLAADTGGPKNQAGTNQRSQTTFVTATMQTRISWYGSLTPAPNGFSVNVARGRYIAFLRTRVSAAASCSIQLIYSVGSAPIQTNTAVTFSDLGAGGVGNTTSWGVVYLGEVNIPYTDRRASVGGDGRGLWIDTAGGVIELSLGIQASRASGAGSLYMGDLILIPIDEAALKIAASQAVGSGAVNLRSWNYDNTGYFAHGLLGDYATVRQYAPGTTAESEFDSPTLTGASLTLTPNTNNRLYFFMTIDSTNRSAIDDPSASTVRVDIVPRWSGVRDV